MRLQLAFAAQMLVPPLASMQRVLAHAGARRLNIDALVCTGDIVNDEPDGYAHFARELSSFGKPVYCIPGNHDDPVRLQAPYLSAEERARIFGQASLSAGRG